MKKPELVLIAGCNAAGKSTFIRTRLNELEGFEILMTDVYKGRTKELAKQAINLHKDILIETVFNDDLLTIDRITSDPNIMNGKACVRGMRITYHYHHLVILHKACKFQIFPLVKKLGLSQKHVAPLPAPSLGEGIARAAAFCCPPTND